MKRNRKKTLYTLLTISIIIVICILINIFKKENNDNMHINQDKQFTYKSKSFSINLSTLDYSNMDYINSIYYRKIYYYEDYLKYKSLYKDILDVDEGMFIDNFVIIGFSNSASINNLEAYKVYNKNNTLYIGLKKYINDSNIKSGISILISKKFDNENLEIYKTIENEDYLISDEYKNIKQLEYNYTIEQAKNDNCIIISNDGKAYNEEKIEEFIKKSKEKQTSFIRIVIYGDNNLIRICDLKYDKDNDYFLLCVDDTRTDFNSTYNYYKYKNIEILTTQDGDKLYKLTDENEQPFDLCFVNKHINNS